MAHSDSLNLKAPKPPSSKETDEDPDRTLQWLRDRIAELYSFDGPEQEQDDATTSTVSAYLDFHNAVHSYCVATMRSSRSRGATLNGEELYRALEQATKTYCQQSREYINAASKTLAAYVEQWNTFVNVSNRTERLFRFLERHWIRRALGEKQKDIYELRDLHMRTWREEVLGVESTKILDAMSQLQKDKLRAKDEDKKLLEDSLASLKDVGLALSEGSLVPLES